MERLQINGVWYVREDQPTQEYEILHSRQMEIVLHNGNRLQAVVLVDGDRLYMPWIEYIDDVANTKEDWDAESWIKGVAEGNPDSLEELRTSPSEVYEPTILLAKEMVALGWVK